MSDAKVEGLPELSPRDADLVRNLRALIPHLCARDIIVLQHAAARIEAIASAEPVEPTCPHCPAKVLYECPACSTSNYPVDGNALSAHGLPVVDELARFKRALAEYPFKNRQQLQAHKVCKGVIELAASYAGDAK